MCYQFMKGAEEAMNVVEKIFLTDKEVNYCLASDACQRNGGIFMQDDDMVDILAKKRSLTEPIHFTFRKQ